MYRRNTCSGIQRQSHPINVKIVLFIKNSVECQEISTGQCLPLRYTVFSVEREMYQHIEPEEGTTIPETELRGSGLGSRDSPHDFRNQAARFQARFASQPAWCPWRGHRGRGHVARFATTGRGVAFALSRSHKSSQLDSPHSMLSFPTQWRRIQIRGQTRNNREQCIEAAESTRRNKQPQPSTDPPG